MDDAKGPIDGMGSLMLAQIVQRQITQSYDAHRMRDFWRRLFTGDNDPDVMAEGMVMALSGGQFVPHQWAKGTVINVAVHGEATAEQVANALRGVIA
ncbi:hypothetical protein PS3A_60730 [Pseudomonas sp. 3A(2025)]